MLRYRPFKKVNLITKTPKVCSSVAVELLSDFGFHGYSVNADLVLSLQPPLLKVPNLLLPWLILYSLIFLFCISIQRHGCHFNGFEFFLTEGPYRQLQQLLFKISSLSPQTVFSRVCNHNLWPLHRPKWAGSGV